MSADLDARDRHGLPPRPDHDAFIAATATLFAPGPQSNDTNVICPHCGHAYEAQAEDWDESSREIECEECGATFTVRAEISITYHTTYDLS